MVTITATDDVSTFAILDRLADIENLLDTKPSDDDDFIRIEKTYSALKERIFESFYTSPDIEEIIVDSEHRHHELVLRLYTEFMDEVSFLPFENIELEREETEEYFHFDNAQHMENIERTLYASHHRLDGDLKEAEGESVKKIHSNLTESELYRVENKIESLIALLHDVEESREISRELLECFLQARSIELYHASLSHIMDGYRLEKDRYLRKLEKIEISLSAAQHAHKSEGYEDDLLCNRKVLKLHKKAIKVKEKWLSKLHQAYCSLDLIHEKLYAFYHHLIEHAKLN